MYNTIRNISVKQKGRTLLGYCTVKCIKVVRMHVNIASVHEVVENSRIQLSYATPGAAFDSLFWLSMYDGCVGGTRRALFFSLSVV